MVVFANTKRRVEVGARNFKEFGTVAIHGDKPQVKRARLFGKHCTRIGIKVLKHPPVLLMKSLDYITNRH